MKTVSLVLASLLILSIAQAQNFGVSEHSIKSRILKQQRKILIFTPEDYSSNADQAYHVAYVLDGQWNFHYLAHAIDKLQSSGDIPRMIVVGIINEQRSKDLTPAGVNDNPRFGGAAEFLSFITEELQPWVDQNYRTHPYNVLLGHSFGGLFTVYSLMEQPQAFQGYVALSPSLGRNNEQQVNRAATFFKDQKEIRPASLYLAIGNEGGYTKASTQRLAAILEQASPSYLQHKFEVLLEESHESITTTGFLRGLRFVYSGFNAFTNPDLDELFLVEQHYQSLADRFGHSVKVPEHFYEKFAQQQLGARELDYTKYILGRYEQQYPQSMQLARLYADVYLLSGEIEKAKEYYQKLVQAGVEDENLKKLLQALPD